jgi:hypothetical protein
MAVSEAPALISETTVWSLFATVVILAAGYFSSRLLLPTSASNKTRFLFIWHATDALIHFVLEGGYLYQCFFSSSSLAEAGVPGSEYLPRDVFFLGDRENVYGASYGSSPMSALWREYARADKRWGGSDLTVISLELLTVFVAGPLAVWICYCIKKNRSDASFWMIVLATGELYGGWMTFVPVRQSSLLLCVRTHWLTCVRNGYVGVRTLKLPTGCSRGFTCSSSIRSGCGFLCGFCTIPTNQSPAVWMGRSSKTA